MNVVLLLVLLISALIGSGAPAAQTKSLVWDRYAADLAVQQDGDLRVTETQALNFTGSFSQAYREIPLDRTTGITDVTVGEPGKPYKPGTSGQNTYSTSTTQDNALRIDWRFPATSGPRTFVLQYTVHGALRYYDAGDQLYWLAIWDKRPGAVKAAQVTVTLPQPVPQDKIIAAVDASQYMGQPQFPQPGTVAFSGSNLPAEQGVEVRVQFPHGIVQGSPPPWQVEADQADAYSQNVAPILNFLLLVVGLLVLIGGGAWLFLTWSTRGRDPSVGSVPDVLEQPPSDLPPGVVGTLVDERADVQDVLATLLDLARRGVISIGEGEPSEAFASGRDFVIERKQPGEAGLQPFESTVLKAILAGADSVRVSEMKGRFQAHIPLFQEQLYDEVARAGLFTANPEVQRKRYRGLSTTLIAIGIVGGLIAIFVLSRWAALAFFPFLGLLVVGIALRFVARAMGQRTRAGALESERWRAFGRYLARAQHQADHDQLERYLPYSVALGADKSFVAQFAAAGAPPPSYYGGRGGYGPGGYGPGGYGGIPPVIVVPGGGWGGGGYQGGNGGNAGGGQAGTDGGGAWTSGSGSGGGAQDWSNALSDLLNNASDALSRGGGSGGWSGGGGGWGGGGGGGGSSGGGGGGGFS